MIFGDASLYYPGDKITNAMMSSGAEYLVVANEYNELGELIAKKLHSGDATSFKQQVDYRYNIRGWLTRINNSDVNITTDGGPRDLFGMELGYNESLGIGTTAAQFNGNISAMKWSTNLGLESGKGELGYKFVYDPMNRLREANHAQKNTTWAASASFAESIPGYDLNGNIQFLNRTGMAGSNMDELSYTYTGNQLTAVADAGIDTVGFRDGNVLTDYAYDANGNMIFDLNKEIDSIAYNNLNLPALVRKTSGDYITYTYDATGRKLTQRVFNSSDSLVKETEYMGAFFYENDTLKFINHAEGRVVMAEDQPEYQYHLKDHLGNVRMTFTTKEEVESNIATLEAANLVEEQGEFLRYENARRVQAALFDHTNGTSTGYSQRLNGTANEIYGLARSISVMPGDTVRAEVFVKYVDEEPGNWTQALEDLMAAIAGNTGGIVMDGGNYSGSTSSFSYGGLVNTSSSSPTEPKAFLNWIIFDKDINFIDGGFLQVSQAAKESGGDGAHERLFNDSIFIRQPGYVYIYLSNENGDPVEVFFDDFGVEHVKSPVVQMEDYYPFGMRFNSFQKENAKRQNYLYNGKEFQDEIDLGLIDFGARMYMPDVGRFVQADPLSELVYDNSNFTYGANNPLRFIDPTGMTAQDTVKKEETNRSEDGDRNSGGKVYNAELDDWVTEEQYNNWQRDIVLPRRSHQRNMSVESERRDRNNETAIDLGTGLLTESAFYAVGGSVFSRARIFYKLWQAKRIAQQSIRLKLLNYLLNADHPVGGSKAKWFRQALGFTKENLDDLAKQISFNPTTAVKTAQTIHGTKFNQVITITGANGRKIDVVFAWIKNNDGMMRLITATPK